MHANEVALELQRILPELGFARDPLVLLRIDEGQLVDIPGMRLRVYLVDAEAQRIGGSYAAIWAIAMVEETGRVDIAVFDDRDTRDLRLAEVLAPTSPFSQN